MLLVSMTIPFGVDVESDLYDTAGGPCCIRIPGRDLYYRQMSPTRFLQGGEIQPCSCGKDGD